MKLTCPNDPAHVRFIVSVRTRETWIVDRVGDWIANVPDAVEVDHYPSFSDDFECEECGAFAVKHASEAAPSRHCSRCGSGAGPFIDGACAYCRVREAAKDEPEAEVSA